MSVLGRSVKKRKRLDESSEIQLYHKIESVLLLFKEMGDIAWLNLLIVSLQAIHEEKQQVKLWILGAYI